MPERFRGIGTESVGYHSMASTWLHRPALTRVNEVIDLWSEDSKQDAWFTCSALDIGFQWLEKAFPGYNVYLFSGRFICTYFFYKYAVLFNCRRLMKCTEQFVLYSKKINKQAELAVHFLLY